MSERVTEETRTVSVPGGQLIGVRSGSGRPLLVLLGGPAVNDYSDWFAGELVGWDALRYTQRGVGPSVRAATLLQIARRNGVPLPADSLEGLAGLYEYRDFSQFIDVWVLTTRAPRTELDVCPISNVRTGVVDSLAEHPLPEHPLPELAAAGIACSVSTDDPAMFGTDLAVDYTAAIELGVTARDCYPAGERGAA